MFADAYRGKTVFLTGHTGFKGSWLSLWLARLGAKVVGYALPPPTDPSLFVTANIAAGLRHIVADIRDRETLQAALVQARPDFIFHLAAQPLVLDSYAAPAETFAINVGGTINVLEAIRHSGMRAAVVMVTTDKVYRNNDDGNAFREDDALGGHDPYSASKAAMEIAIACWRSSYFPPDNDAEHGVRIACARAGNVIGGGDWSANRLVPDLARTLSTNQLPRLRNPASQRPWQHVLEPLGGYLWLGARLAASDGPSFAQNWNFGPHPRDVKSVQTLSEALLARWGRPGWQDTSDRDALHEAKVLRLAIDKAQSALGWQPIWNFVQTAHRTADWYESTSRGISPRGACEADIAAFCADAIAKSADFAG